MNTLKSQRLFWEYNADHDKKLVNAVVENL